MRHTFLNLKRLDILRGYGGVNGAAPVEEWGNYIAQNIQKKLRAYGVEDVGFVIYFPGAYLIPAVKAPCGDNPVEIGCQGVYRDDTAENSSFGVFTTSRTANTTKVVGYNSVIIGHREEWKDRAGILKETGVTDEGAVGRLLSQEIKTVIQADLTVPCCIGETDGKQEQRQEVLKSQLETGLRNVDKEKVVIAYEPIRTIGPDKTPPDEAYITEIGSYIKEMIGGMGVIYKGGLKTDNARMLASVPVMDGGLIVLTRFRGKIGFYPEEYLEIVRIRLEQDWNV